MQVPGRNILSAKIGFEYTKQKVFYSHSPKDFIPKHRKITAFLHINITLDYI